MSERDKVLAELIQQEEMKRAFFPDIERRMQLIQESFQGMRPTLDVLERMKVELSAPALEALTSSQAGFGRALQSYAEEMARTTERWQQLARLPEWNLPDPSMKIRRLMEDNNRALVAAFQHTAWDPVLSGLVSRLDLDKSRALDLSSVAAAWSDETFHQRLPLVEMSLQNVAALEALEVFSLARYTQPEPLVVERMQFAGDLVSRNAEFVRRLPVEHPEGAEPGEEEPVHEELGERLTQRLAAVDPRLAQLRREAWRSLQGGIAGARLAEHGIREILKDLLHKFAPDAEVMRSQLWEQRKDRKLKQPTRRMRFTYIVGEAGDEVASVIQFDSSVRLAQKYAHTFAEDVLVIRAHLVQVEACINLLLTYILERPRA